jgi:UDP-N-acetylglucosamine 2-epimerase (non-hydrolysing)
MKIVSVFRIRPEAITLAPLMRLLKSDLNINHKMLSTGQHKEMLYQVLKCFGLHPDYNWDVIKTWPDLSEMTSLMLWGCKEVFEKDRPDLMLVHGDATTAVS